jgi:hypothetical protein
MNKDARITGILAEFDEDLSSTWLVQGQRVIYHSALERIAAKAGIRFDRPEVIRAQEKEAVILVSGARGDQLEWSIGEANMELNYRTSGKQQAYPYAMAEKRAKDRVILKLIQLHGLLYSEEESDEFKESAAGDRREVMSDAITSGKPIHLDDGVVHPSDALKRLIQEKGTVQGVKELMLRHEVQVYLSSIPEDQKDELRNVAKSRMVDLGWKRANG